MSEKQHSGEEAEEITCFQLYRIFFGIGLMTFGGGFAMATVVRHELVFKRGWLTKREFVNSLSTASAVPGAIAVNLAFMEGYKLKGLKGAFSAALGQVCPSVIVILLVAQFAQPYFDRPLVSAFLKGAAIGVAGQIGFAAYSFAHHLRRVWENALVCLIALLMVLWGVHPVWAIVTAAGMGYLIMHKRMLRRPEEEREEDEENEEEE
ncbi:MAG: chromate transporter [Planctomycetota bacterium]